MQIRKTNAQAEILTLLERPASEFAQERIYNNTVHLMPLRF